jgi:uncharacterized protein YlxW (UPF0749 family)
VLVAVILAALGFAAVVQVRANDRDTNFVGARQSDLVALIDTLSLATDRAQSEIADLQRTRASLLNDAEASRTALEVARKQAATLGILDGTLAAEGPGIRITVKAAPGALGTDQFLNGLEELRNAGAEAIEINDTVRVIAQTAISDSPGKGLEVGGVAIRPPFVLDVIGDPHTLSTALDFEGGFTSGVEDVGGRVTVQEQDLVQVTSTRRVPAPLFAKPVPQG